MESKRILQSLSSVMTTVLKLILLTSVRAGSIVVSSNLNGSSWSLWADSKAIVKLQMQYENQPNGDTRWAMGTGWLVAPDVLVTAGHCVYMWKDGWGRVKKINAYIGYSGKDSLKAPNVQARRGIRAVTTEGYLAGPQHRVNDVGFLKLDKPFQGVTPFQFANTPIKDKLTLGVIGYPADKYDPITNERGSHMWGEYAPVDYDLKLGNQTDMLQYKLSTYPGKIST